MANIKTLYLEAKIHPNDDNVKLYIEELDKVKDRPLEYMSNLEYIISSSIGLNTFEEFVNKYGIPIPLVEHCINTFEKCIDKCKSLNKDYSKYNEICNVLNEYKNNHIKSFAMFEYYANSDDYVKYYYGFTGKNQNRRLLDGMIKRFGEMAIPDMLLTADTISNESVEKVYEYVSMNDHVYSPKLYEWMYQVGKDLRSYNEDNNIMNSILEKVPSIILENINYKNYMLEQAEMLKGNLDIHYEYTSDEIDVLRDLIEYKEYEILWLDEYYKNYNESDFISIIKEKSDQLLSIYEKLNIDITDDDLDMFIEKDNPPAYLDRMEKRGLEYDGEGDKKKESEENNTKEDDYVRPSYNNKPSTGVVDDEDEDSEDYDDEEKEVIRNINRNRSKSKSNSRNHNSNNINITFGNIDEDFLELIRKKKNKHKHHEDNENNNPKENENNRRKNKPRTKPRSQNLDDFVRERKSKKEQSTDEQNDDVDKSQTESSFNLNNPEPWKLNLFDNDYFTETLFDRIGFSEKKVSEEDLDDNGQVYSDQKPTSDHFIRDTLIDVDRHLVSKAQSTKSFLQSIKNIGKAAIKPFARLVRFVDDTIDAWSKKKENDIKRDMIDTTKRRTIFKAIKSAIFYGSVAKAGLLFHPISLYIMFTNWTSGKATKNRLRMELLTELKTEMELCDAKIEIAKEKGDRVNQFELMRLKNEINKKYLRVSGGWNTRVKDFDI